MAGELDCDGATGNPPYLDWEDVHVLFLKSRGEVSMVLELLAALSLAAMPQDTGRLPVYVNFNGNDIVGQRLKYQLSQSLARSSTLSAAVNADRSIFIVNLTTLGSPAGETHQTIYSVSYLLRDGEGLDGYLDGTVAFCGSDRLPECAESIVADVDAQRTLFLEVLANLEDEAPFSEAAF